MWVHLQDVVLRGLDGCCCTLNLLCNPISAVDEVCALGYQEGFLEGCCAGGVPIWAQEQGVVVVVR